MTGLVACALALLREVLGCSRITHAGRILDMPIDTEHLTRFKSDLSTLPADEVYRRYVLPDTCKGLTEVDELALRSKIATKFKVDVSNIIIVGSAKLGFTLRHKPKSENIDERPAFSPFSESSDIDIAVVSDVLFDYVWKQCLEFWHTSGYANSRSYWSSGQSFRDYFFRGWMRPDKLPSEGEYHYKRDWFDFFRRQLASERAAGDYTINAGLYRESYFLETYQKIAINECCVQVKNTK